MPADCFTVLDTALSLSLCLSVSLSLYLSVPRPHVLPPPVLPCVAAGLLWCLLELNSVSFAVIFAHRYAVTITICGVQWGWTVLGVLVLGGGAYVGGGVMLGGRAGRGSGKGADLTAHPHFEQWEAVRGLFHDGVRFCQARVGGRGQPAVNGGYSRVGDSSGDGAGSKGKKRHSKRDRG